MLSEMLKGAIQGWSEYRRNNPKPWEYEAINTQDILYSSRYLNDLYSKAKTKDQLSEIYTHLVRHDVCNQEFGSYFDLYENLKNDLWEE